MQTPAEVIQSSVVDVSGSVRRWWTRRRRAFAWLFLVLAGCTAGFALVYWFTVRTVPGRVLDDSALRGADLGSSRASDNVEAVLDVITVTSMVAAVALVSVIALLRMRRNLGVAAVGVLVMSSVVSRILKAYLLPRPDLGLDEVTPATLNSLPSGHATAAFSIGVALLFVVPAALRRATAAVALAFSSAVAIATMSAAWHRAGDSLASFLLVTGCAAFIAVLVLLADGPADDADPMVSAPRPQTGRWAGLLLAGMLLLAGVLVWLLMASTSLRDSALGAPMAFFAAGLLIVASAAACTRIVLGIVERISPTSTALQPPAAQPEERPSAPTE